MIDWSQGYKTNLSEGEISDLEITGKIPGWLSGVLLRNGPADFEAGNKQLNSWIDGFAKIHSMKFEKSKVTYNRKFLSTKEFLNSNKLNHLYYDEFGSNSNHPRLNKFRSLLFPNFSDNASVNIYKFGEQFVALSETLKSRIIFDESSLASSGYFKFNDSLKEHLSTAHLLYDHKNKKYFGFSTHFGLVSEYIVYTFDDINNPSRKVIARVKLKNPSYMHSFAMTENYIILIENPVRLKLFKFLFTSATLADQISINHKEKVNLIIINKKTSEISRIKLKESFFVFHQVNAYEENSLIKLDLIAHRGLGFIKDMNLKSLYNHHIKNKLGGDLRRYYINLEGLSSHFETLYEGCVELPVINPEFVEQNYKFSYFFNMSKENEPYDELIKFNFESREQQIWKENYCYPSEPAFIKDPNAKNEDDGILMSFVSDFKNKNSFVLILDAKNFKEISRIIIPDLIPFGSHGAFFSSK